MTSVSTIRITQWRDDLHYLAEELPKRHKNFFHTMTQAQFDQAVHRLDQQIPALARHEIIVELARIVAMVGDGHTRIQLLEDDAVGFRHYPIRLYLYSDGLFVQAASREHSQAAGAKVLRIGDGSADEALAAARALVSRDNEMGVKSLTPSYLACPEILHALRLTDDKDHARFLLESNGQPFSLDLQPLEPGASVEWIEANHGAERPLPLWLKDPTNPYWFEYLEDPQMVYLQYNQVNNREDEAFEAFCSRAFAFVHNNPIDYFFLDIRLNSGGNGHLNQPLIHGLIKSDKVNQWGRLFVIIGRRTWSAAGMCAVDLEQHTKALFVGEPTAARPNAYDDGGSFELPNSSIAVGYSPLYRQVSHPRDERPWVAPHILAELSSEDHRTNRDPAFQAILNEIANQTITDPPSNRFRWRVASG